MTILKPKVGTFAPRVPRSCRLIVRSSAQRRDVAATVVSIHVSVSIRSYPNSGDSLLSFQEAGSLVLVAGATGGVGQLVTAKLIEVGYGVMLTLSPCMSPYAQVTYASRPPRFNILLVNIYRIQTVIICSRMLHCGHLHASARI